MKPPSKKYYLVSVKPNSQENLLEHLGQNRFKIKVTKPARGNQANKEVIKMLARFFCVPKGSLKIKSGSLGKIKIIEHAL